MSYLNANIPPIYCKIRREYLYDLREHHGEVEDLENELKDKKDTVVNIKK